MSTQSDTSQAGGMALSVDIDVVNVEQVDDPRRAIAVEEALDDECARLRALVETSLDAVRESEVTVDIPDRVSEVPSAEFGGREWVESLEGDVPFGALSHLVVAVEGKRKLQVAERKRDQLESRHGDSSAQLLGAAGT